MTQAPQLGLTDWPDTSDTEPPSDHLEDSAIWLLGRHPLLAELVTRCPGVVGRSDNGRDLALDLDLLSDGLAILDGVLCFFEPLPPCSRTGTKETMSETKAAPSRLAASKTVTDEVTVMSGSEKTMLRLLATFSTGARLRVSDIQRLQASDERLVEDWVTAVSCV
jgi:hypothetical protein